MKWTKVNDEIYTSPSSIVSIHDDDISFLKSLLSKSPNKRVRICSHQSSADSLHEMHIVIARGSYIRPHKHKNKSESFHIIDGLLDVIIFDDDGNIVEIIELGKPGSRKNFYYRLSAPYFHSLIIKSEYVIFHETTNGPFIKGETIYAPWAPEEIEAGLQYILELESKLKNIKVC